MGKEKSTLAGDLDRALALAGDGTARARQSFYRRERDGEGDRRGAPERRRMAGSAWPRGGVRLDGAAAHAAVGRHVAGVDWLRAVARFRPAAPEAIFRVWTANVSGGEGITYI